MGILKPIYKVYIQKNQQFSFRGSAAIGLIGVLLGTILGLGIGIFLFSSFVNFGLFLIFFVFFHLSEFLYVAIFRPSELTSNSYLLNHSKEYIFALAFSMVEYFVESLFFPGLKAHRLSTFLCTISLIVIIIGQYFRSMAMLTAGTNFNHIIEEEKRDGHILVTTGVYRFTRHPSYFGFFWWSIFTQVLLLNPLSTVGYTIASWKFFNDRIKHEETNLISFFGEKYLDYRKKVPTLIPFL